MEAAKSFEMLQRMGKADGKTLNLLGDIYLNKELLELATRSYINSIDADPAQEIDGTADAGGLPAAARWSADGGAPRRQGGRDLTAASLGEADRIEFLKLRSRIAVSEGKGGRCAPHVGGDRRAEPARRRGPDPASRALPGERRPRPGHLLLRARRRASTASRPTRRSSMRSCWCRSTASTRRCRCSSGRRRSSRATRSVASSSPSSAPRGRVADAIEGLRARGCRATSRFQSGDGDVARCARGTISQRFDSVTPSCRGAVSPFPKGAPFSSRMGLDASRGFA